MSNDDNRPKEGPSILDPAARPRRSTLETFNDELAILDRPIEEDVEYYDEVPPMRRLRLRTVAAAILVSAFGAFWALSGQRSGALALPRSAQAVALVKAPLESPAAATAAPAFRPTGPTAPAIVPSGTSAVPIATAPTATRAESQAPGDEAPTRTSPAPRAVWAKKLHRAGPSKHARSTGNRASRQSGRRRG
jgi:hypothetical protein